MSIHHSFCDSSFILTKILVDAPQSIVVCKAFRHAFLDAAFMKTVKFRLWGLHKTLLYAASVGYLEWCRELIAMGAPHATLEAAMHAAALAGHGDIIDVCIENGAKSFVQCMKLAARRGHRAVTESFIAKIGDTLEHWIWEDGMASAAEGGHREIVELFISCGADWWNGGMASAARGGHLDLAEFFVARGASWWSHGMVHAALAGHRALVDYFVNKGADDWEAGMAYAAEGGHMDLVQYFADRGADTWNRAMQHAARGGHGDILQFLSSKKHSVM